MKQIFIFLFFFTSGFCLLAQKQITDFDSLSYDSYPALWFLKSENNFLYFAGEQNRAIKKYDINNDTLHPFIKLPERLTHAAFFLQNDQLYALQVDYQSDTTRNEFLLYHIDMEKATLTQLERYNRSNSFSFFITGDGLYVRNRETLFRYDLNKSFKPRIDTVGHSLPGKEIFYNYSDHAYLEAADHKTGKAIKGMIDKSGKFYDFLVPGLENKQLESYTLFNGGVLITCSPAGSLIREQFFLYEGKLNPLPDRPAEPDTKYYAQGSRLIEVYYEGEGLKKTVVINEVKGKERIPIARHTINTFRQYYSVVGMSSPSLFPYSNDIWMNDNFYFLGNDEIKFSEGSGRESNLKLFRVNLTTGDLTTTDANILLNKDLFRVSYTMGGGGYRLEPAEGGLIIYPLRGSDRFHYKTYAFNDAAGSFTLLNSLYDPRYFVYTGSGYYDNRSSVLLDSSGKYVTTIGSKLSGKKAEQVEEERYFGRIFKTHEVIYMAHTGKGKQRISTFNGRSEVKHHSLLDGFAEIRDIEVVNCPENGKHILGIYGIRDTLAIPGTFLYAYDWKSEEMTYLGRSYRMSGLGKPGLIENGSEIVIYSSGYFLKTGTGTTKLVDNINLLNILPDGELLVSKEGNLLYLDEDQSRVISSPVGQAISWKDQVYFFGKDGLLKLDNSGKPEVIMKGNGMGTNTLIPLSESEIFFTLEDKAGILNTTTHSVRQLDFTPEKYSYYGAYKAGVYLLIISRSSYTSLVRYDLRNNTRENINLPPSYQFLYHPAGENWWAIEEKYSPVERNLTYTFKELKEGTLMESHRIRSKTNLSFEKLGSAYYTADSDGKIYYFNADDYSFSNRNNAFSNYKEVTKVLETGSDRDLLAVIPKKKPSGQEIVEFDKRTGTVKVVKPGISVNFEPFTYGENFYFVDTASTNIKILSSKKYTEEQTEIYRHSRTSPVVKYTHFFVFKNNVFSIALTEVGGYQLYQLTENTMEEEEVVLSRELPGLHLTIYPNPATDFLSVKSETGTKEEFKIEVISGQGKVVRAFSTILPVDFSMKSYPAGLYFIRVASREGSKIFRIIKY